MTTEVVHLRLPREDVRWIEELARQNGIQVSAMARSLIHGLRIAVAEGRIDALSMGELQFGPPK
jgi:hypothetical protein